MLLLPVPLRRWSRQAVDLGAVWDRLGWPTPAALRLALTAAATPHDPDRFRVGFGAVEVTEPQIRRWRG